MKVGTRGRNRSNIRCNCVYARLVVEPGLRCPSIDPAKSQKYKLLEMSRANVECAMGVEGSSRLESERPELKGRRDVRSSGFSTPAPIASSEEMKEGTDRSGYIDD